MTQPLSIEKARCPTSNDARESKLIDAILYLSSVVIIFAALGSVTHLLFLIKTRDSSLRFITTPEGKTEHLRTRGEDYEIILWGDSRTYIGVDPTIVGNICGKKAFNYASMAHWFPTQLPQLRKTVPYLTRATSSGSGSS
jgi:hypothetical protein